MMESTLPKCSKDNKEFAITNDNGDYVLSNDMADDDDHLLPARPNPSFLPPRLHEQVGNLVRSVWFQQTMLFLIFFNSIQIALATCDFVTENPKMQSYFDIMDECVLSIFTLELGLHLMYYGHTFFTDGWLLFDLFVVTTSWGFKATSVLRSFRIIRAVRLISRMKDMRDLVLALLRTIPRMGAIAGLLSVIYFVFTVLFTQIFQDAYSNGVTSEDHFSTLGLTAFTLLQFMFMDDWSSVTRELMAEYTLAWVPLLVFIIVCNFIAVNLIIAVICDAVSQLQSNELSTQMEALQSSTHELLIHNERRQKAEVKALEEKIDRLLLLLEQKHK